MKKFPYTPLQIAVHVYAWSVFVMLVFDFFMGNLSPNPIQDLEQRTGRHALTLLVLSLLCTPLNSIFKWSEPLKRRRALGLYSFMYATIHMIIFADLDFGLAWSLLIQEVAAKPRLIVGVIAFVLFIPLAVTSFDIWKVRLGKNWKRLHRLVYLIAPLVLLHYLWSKKGDILSLQGEVIKPLIYGLVIGIFLLIRIPPIRKALASFSSRVLALPFKKNQQPRVNTP
ncbi:MAG: sulfoxide reductase heme-binding subunit YedZ [Anaerolineales bacterium]|nr:sulfoxide reductase heme-binding subunit YedZ [Anaerolineales bacterium]MBP6208223.1 sulfoxide reductase heme-binding subunit YedZ [Anaerolineales bacterium]MBP8164814.1 sulfoxide reductase heme-binding subunit YedZ [Anaerolineales bacterium]